MNIGIAGAGLAGRLLAWRLLRQGRPVTLFDRDEGDGQQSAGFIAAAMLAPYSEIITAERSVFEPGLQSLKTWPLWLEELRRDSGQAVDYQQRGSMVVAHATDMAELRWFCDRLHALPEIADGQCLWLEGNELSEMEPGLSKFSRGIYLPGEGCLDNRALFKALHSAIDNLGGEWRPQHLVSSVDSGEIITERGRFPFDLALDCRGFGGKPQLKEFRGVRGELLWVKAPEVNLTRPVRLMHPRYHLYITPKPGNIYVIGATEIESESLAPVTVRSCLELLSALYSVHSGFAEGELLEARSHCRPAFMDNLPRIIRGENLLRVNGLYRHGYLLGPALVESVLALLDGRQVLPPVTVEGCAGDRSTLNHSEVTQ